MKNNLHFFPPIMGLLLLAGCAGPFSLPLIATGAAAGGGMYETRPEEGAPADTADQIQPHESWCYSTMGENVECFDRPQETPPGRLVNVDPPNRYPLNRKAYDTAVAESQAAEARKDAAARKIADQDMTEQGSAGALGVEPAQMTPMPPVQLAPKAAPTPKPAKKSKAKKHKKPKKAAKPPATTPAPSETAAPPPAIPN